MSTAANPVQPGLGSLDQLPLASLDHLHARFLAILPRIETHAQIHFRHLRCPGKREDAIAEVIALCWRWFLRIEEQGKDVNEFVTTLADYAVRHVRSGRYFCGQEDSKDVLSPLAQRRRSFGVQSLPRYDTGTEDNKTLEALRDNTRTPPDDQAAFRIDFPQWICQLGQRNRGIAEDMMLNETTQDLAVKHKVTQGRISQLRREFFLDWHRFHGEPVMAQTAEV